MLQAASAPATGPSRRPIATNGAPATWWRPASPATDTATNRIPTVATAKASAAPVPASPTTTVTLIAGVSVGPMLAIDWASVSPRESRPRRSPGALRWGRRCWGRC